jgi:hypothetical protein
MAERLNREKHLYLNNRGAGTHFPAPESPTSSNFNKKSKKRLLLWIVSKSDCNYRKHLLALVFMYKLLLLKKKEKRKPGRFLGVKAISGIQLEVSRSDLLLYY